MPALEHELESEISSEFQEFLEVLARLERNAKAKQQPHPDACHCDECEAIRFAYCGYED